MLDPAVFKAYDVRGIYPSELDEEGARAIGRAYVEVFELPRGNSFTRFFAGHFPESGVAAIDALSAYSPHTATLKSHGLYLVIQASSDRLAVAAAHAVGR